LALALALALAGRAAPAPLRYSILVASTQPVYVLPEGQASWSATVELFIDATPIARLAPGAPLATHSLGLDEGTHQYRFSIALRQIAPQPAGAAAAALEMEEDCVGQFEVHGTGFLQPHLEFLALRAAPGKPGDTVACGVTPPGR
jgi:hypothetical protein